MFVTKGAVVYATVRRGMRPQAKTIRVSTINDCAEKSRWGERRTEGGRNGASGKGRRGSTYFQQHATVGGPT